MSEYYYYATYCKGHRPTQALLDTTIEAQVAWEKFFENELEWSKDPNLEARFLKILRRGIDLPCHPYGNYAREKYFSAKEKISGIKKPSEMVMVTKVPTMFAATMPKAESKDQCECNVCQMSVRTSRDILGVLQKS